MCAAQALYMNMKNNAEMSHELIHMNMTSTHAYDKHMNVQKDMEMSHELRHMNVKPTHANDEHVCAAQAFQKGQKAVCPSQKHVIVFHEMVRGRTLAVYTYM